MGGGGSHGPLGGGGRESGWAEAEVRAVACESREEGSRIEENLQANGARERERKRESRRVALSRKERLQPIV